MINRSREPNPQFRESNLILTDVTTADVSTTKHGFAPKGDGDTSKFLNANGGYTVPAGGGGGGGLTLIEHKLITSDAQDYTFSGLDGNTDGIYELICHFVARSGGGTTFSFQPNGVTTNQSSNRFWADNGAEGKDAAGYLKINNVNANSYGMSRVTFYARANPNSVAVKRNYVCNFTYFADTGVAGIMGGEWADTSANVTSIVLHSDQTDGLKSGTELFLYKLAQ